MLLINYLRKD